MWWPRWESKFCFLLYCFPLYHSDRASRNCLEEKGDCHILGAWPSLKGVRSPSSWSPFLAISPEVLPEEENSLQPTWTNWANRKCPFPPVPYAPAAGNVVCAGAGLYRRPSWCTAFPGNGAAQNEQWSKRKVSLTGPLPGHPTLGHTLAWHSPELLLLFCLTNK